MKTPRTGPTSKVKPTPSRKSTRSEFCSFGGTTQEEQQMLRQAIQHILKDKTKFGRSWIATSITNKIKLKVMNEERSIEDLCKDVQRISSDAHTTQHLDNPSRIKYSKAFLLQFQDPSTPFKDDDDDDISTEKDETQSPNLLEDSPKPTKDAQTSPNLLVDEKAKKKAKHSIDKLTTASQIADDIKDATPPAYHPIPSQITPTIQNLQSAMKQPPSKATAPTTDLDRHAIQLFPTEPPPQNIIEEPDNLDDDSLITKGGSIASGDNPSTIDTQNTREPADDNSIDTAQRLQDFQISEHITAMMNHIINSEGNPLIKKLVDAALHERLHDESLDTELDEKYQSLAQQIQIADSMDTRIAAKIADAEAIEKLLDKRTIKAKKDYTEIKANEKELDKRNKELKLSITEVMATLKETTKLHEDVVKNQTDHLTMLHTHYSDLTKKIEINYKRFSVDSETMAKNSQTKSLAKFEETYQKRLGEINVAKSKDFKEICNNITTKKAAILQKAVDQHVNYIKTQTDDTEEIFQSFVNQAPMAAQRDIQAALEDCIEETLEELEKKKDKLIAAWSTTFTDPTNHATIKDSIIKEAQQTLDQAIQSTTKEIKRTLTPEMDKMFEDRRATYENYITKVTARIANDELDKYKLQLTQTGDDQIANQKSRITKTTTEAAQEFKERMQTMIKEETSDQDSSLQTNILVALTDATEKMYQVKEDTIADILHNAQSAFKSTTTSPPADSDKAKDPYYNPYDKTRKTRDPYHNPSAKTTHPSEHYESSQYQGGNHHSETPAPDLDNRHWQANVIQIKRSASVTANLPRFKKEIIQHNLRPDPRQDQLESFYDTMVTSLESYEIPILRRQDLRPRGTTRPSEPLINVEVDSIVSRVIYNKLLETIPDECTTLREIIGSYASEQDGYSTLYSIMRTKCRYLQDLLPKWGPNWNKKTTAYQYLAQLKSHLEEAQRTSKNYSTFEVAAEILQQAKQHAEYHLIATSYLTRLLAYTSQREDIPTEYRYDNLICTLETNKDNGAASMSIPLQPQINRFSSNGNGGNGRDPNRQPFQYRNPVQCKACKTFGHCIGDNVCRFSAQCLFATEYNDKEPAEAKANATAFATANNKNKISKVKLLHPTAFNPDMSLEEEEYTLCMIARVMQEKDDEA